MLGEILEEGMGPPSSRVRCSEGPVEDVQMNALRMVGPDFGRGDTKKELLDLPEVDGLADIAFDHRPVAVEDRQRRGPPCAGTRLVEQAVGQQGVRQAHNGTVRASSDYP